MPPRSPSTEKIFTAEQANAALPLVRAIVADLSELSVSVAERQQRVAHLTAGRDFEDRDFDNSDPYSEELAHVEEELEHDVERLKEYIGELRDLGVEPKSAQDGLVDFPGELDGRPVYFCWKLGEPEVRYWHELDAGFAGRQLLASRSEDGGGQDGESLN